MNTDNTGSEFSIRVHLGPSVVLILQSFVRLPTFRNGGPAVRLSKWLNVAAQAWRDWGEQHETGTLPRHCLTLPGWAKPGPRPPNSTRRPRTHRALANLWTTSSCR